MKTLLYGGTFDPIHFGHLLTAQRAAELLQAERVVFIPANVNPLKKGKMEGVEGSGVGGQATAGEGNGEHRLAMVRLAIAGEARFVVDDLELRRAGPSYTIDTIEALLPKYGPELTLLLGADQLAHFHHWHRVTDLLGKVEIALLGRPGTGMEAGLASIGNRMGEQVMQRLQQGVLATPLVEISATEIRNRVKAGLSIAYLTPAAVGEYIRIHGCYV